MISVLRQGGRHPILVREFWITTSRSWGTVADNSNRCFSSGRRDGGEGYGSVEATSSSPNEGQHKNFRPRRRSSRKYRPITPLVKKSAKQLELDAKANANNPLYQESNPYKVVASEDDPEGSFGHLADGVIENMRREARRLEAGELVDVFEEELRKADYLTSEYGSTEDLMFARRLLAEDIPDEDARRQYVMELEEKLEKQRQVELLEDVWTSPVKEESPATDPTIFDPHDDGGNDGEEDDPNVILDPNQLAHGEWSEMLITVDRTTKLWRGGRLESYRALVIGGNLNGCGGFGIGKSGDAITAVTNASRKCKKNIFFVERYQGNGLTSDLAGKQNSCKVYLRSTTNGLRGNPLICEILKRFGITNCVSKAHGNRNPYNVVRGTFKALMTHKSIEDIALMRGKRILSVDRAIRMQI